MRRADSSLVGDTSVARIASDTSRITITVARSRGIGCVQTGLANAIARPVRLASVRKEATPRRQRPGRRGGECVAVRKRSADRFLDSLVMPHARRIKGTARTPQRSSGCRHSIPYASRASRSPVAEPSKSPMFTEHPLRRVSLALVAATGQATKRRGLRPR